MKKVNGAILERVYGYSTKGWKTYKWRKVEITFLVQTINKIKEEESARMKKRGMSARIGAIILAASMVVGDAAPTLAAQQANVDEDAIVFAEFVETTENSETEEVSETTETTETAETEVTEATEETSEAAETTETTETEATEETSEATEAAEITETSETTEAAEATETSETTETTEATETAEEAEEENVLLGSEVGVSQVIGVEGEDTTDDTFTNSDGTIKKTYSYVNKANQQDNYITVAGTVEEKLDAATGLYKYNDVYYSYGQNNSNGTCCLSGKVVKTFAESPSADVTTDLYLVDGKYYSRVGSAWDKEDTKVLVYYVTVDNEVDVLGTIAADAAPETTFGKKVAEGEKETVKYYEANGKDYTRCEVNTLSDGSQVVYADKSDEISFTKKHHEITWNGVSNPTEVSANGKLYYIGYQVKVNGTDAKLGVEAADGQTFTTDTSFETPDVFAPGEQNIYEVRAIYYTTTKTAVKDAEGRVSYKYDYAVAKTGEWSAAYAYAVEAEKELQKVPTVTNLTATKKKNNKVELNWDAVAVASGYEIEYVTSDTPLTDDMLVDRECTDEDDWDYYKDGKYYISIWNELDTTSYTYHEETLDYKYTYYRVKAYVNYENDVYQTGDGEPSNVVSVEMDEVKTDVVTVSGFKAEAQTDGTYKLKWDELPSSTSVYIYRTTDKSVFASTEYLLDLIDAEGTYLYDAEDNETKEASYTSDEKVREAYQIATRKLVDGEYMGVYSGNDGVNGTEVSVPAEKTYYFVAVTVDRKNHNTDRSAYTPYVGTRLNSENKEVEVKYGYYNDVAASAVISATGVLEKPSKPDTKSEKTSITMTFNKQDGATGYEIYKKNSKGKYKKLATTTSAQYVDEDLTEGTTYSYKARAYVYNTVTKKKVYSEYVFFSAETSTKNYIDVTATMASKNSVKVKWTKVTGADKYEIYRTSTSSTNTSYSSKNKKGTQSNEKWKLVKTITKAKTVSYTDKKLNAGETYEYKVVAYYKDGNATKQIDDKAKVSLLITPPANVKAVLSKNKVNVTWDKNSYATKYELRYTKMDSQGKAYTEDPVVVSTKKTSYTISGLKTGDYVEDVRVRAYDGKKWSSWSSVWRSENVSLAAAKSVSAKNVTVKDANGVESTKVQVSWKAVSGAAYYKVYRSTSPALQYDADNKVYTGLSDCEAIVKESNTDESSANEVVYDDYKGWSDTIVGTKAIDGGQLQSGVTYYYFVVAYSENGRVSSYGVAKNASITFNATPSIKSVKATKGKVTVKINKVAGAKKYVVYRSTKKNKGYVEIGTTKKLTYVDKKATKGKTYYYKVVAVGTNALKADFETGMSAASKKVKAK